VKKALEFANIPSGRRLVRMGMREETVLASGYNKGNLSEHVTASACSSDYE
jgi:hypothetical protein